MLDLINMTEEDLLKSMKKAMSTPIIATQDKVDECADKLYAVTKKISDETGN